MQDVFGKRERGEARSSLTLYTLEHCAVSLQGINEDVRYEISVFNQVYL